MASAATNLFDAESFIGMTLGGGSDKAGRSDQIFSKAFPFAIPALNIRISPITIHATSANGIFLEVEDIRIWHPIQNLTYGPNSGTTKTDQSADSLSSLCCHFANVWDGADNHVLRLIHVFSVYLSPPWLSLTHVCEFKSRGAGTSPDR